MLLAVVGTLLRFEVVNYHWIFIAFFLGSAIGVPIAYIMPMTAVPQRTAFSHACGALASALIGTAEYYKGLNQPNGFTTVEMTALIIEILLGFLTFTASLMAFGKLQEVLPQRPMTYKGQNFVNLGFSRPPPGSASSLIVAPERAVLFPIFVALALIFGVLLIIPIGGADMPTVIALLNSYAGLSACAMGFVLNNKLLIIAGALDGSSGLILSIIMCRAMNRSFSNVLFGAFGQLQTTAAAIRSAALSLRQPGRSGADSGRSANRGGHSRATAWRSRRRSTSCAKCSILLTKRGVNVEFAIHPVAGRMPGHMNVLLAEADVPYDKLREMDDINPEMPDADVALIIGANDVVNPGAETDPKSPIAGMPIIQAYKARTVMVIKRSMNPGFAGIDNDLYYMPNTHDAVRRCQSIPFKHRERAGRGRARRRRRA